MDLIVQTILDIGIDEFYRSSRYKVPLVVVLINSNDKNAFKILEKHTRRTDIVQQLSAELLVVYLPHIRSENAYHFIKNMKEKLNFTYTMGEYKDNESEFIYNLLVQNSKKI